MVRLNRKVEYALIALKYMSGKYAGHITTVKEICTATGVPFDATSRVMQLMVKKQILKAEIGAGGGYLLVRDLSKVSFLEIVELISGQVKVVRCVSGAGDCDIMASCNVVSPLRELNSKLVEFYQSLSVADLLKRNEQKSHSVGPHELIAHR
jgi:Rrf2 family nitric oxide-sensitive transcriptional repressor